MLTSIALTIALIGASVDIALATSPYPSRAPESTIEPTLTQILATQATAPALSPVSNVKGVAFDRFIQIWLENTVSSESRKLELNIELILTHIPMTGLHIGRRGPQFEISRHAGHSPN
jgi:hypothetical protein